MEAIRSRRGIRKFKNDPVFDSHIQEIPEAARLRVFFFGELGDLKPRIIRFTWTAWPSFFSLHRDDL